MTLSTCIQEYVRHRRSLGVQFHGEQVQLSAFVKSVGDIAFTATVAGNTDVYVAPSTGGDPKRLIFDDWGRTNNTCLRLDNEERLIGAAPGRWQERETRRALA